jgi:hypothetical protein
MVFAHYAFVFALALAASAAYAQKAGLEPGEYLDGSGGYLLIKPAKDGVLPFEIRTISPARHSCEVDGRIAKNGQALLKPGADLPNCTVHFERKGDGIEVSLKSVCPGYCGARASFDGMYLKPAQGCDRAGLRKTRAEFKRFYDRKAYSEARAALEPMLKRCEKTLDEDEDGWIRNDLAITYLRLGDPAECRNVLQPLAANAAKTEAQLREDLIPNDPDRTLRIARATRTNLKLCQR